MNISYPELVECLGELDAERLLRELGGTRVEVPQSAPGSKLAGVLGDEAAARLIAEIGPGRITLPQGPMRGIAGRRARAKELLTNGRSTREVARELDLHVRTVEGYRREMREDRQLRFPLD